MKKAISQAEALSKGNDGQSTSPYREVELSEAQKAFQNIVNVIDNHANCSSFPKKDLSKDIKLIADEIVKSKIRDKLLLSQKADLNTKLALMGIDDKQENELVKLKKQIESQGNSIKNQAIYVGCLMDQKDTLNEENKTLSQEVETLNQEVETLKQKGETLNQKVETLNQEVDSFKVQNDKLLKENSELLSQINKMLP